MSIRVLEDSAGVWIWLHVITSYSIHYTKLYEYFDRENSHKDLLELQDHYENEGKSFYMRVITSYSIHYTKLYERLMILAANFKSNLTRAKTAAYLEQVEAYCSAHDVSDTVMVFPPASALQESTLHVKVGAQNAFAVANGAYIV